MFLALLVRDGVSTCTCGTITSRRVSSASGWGSTRSTCASPAASRALARPRRPHGLRPAAAPHALRVGAPPAAHRCAVHDLPLTGGRSSRHSRNSASTRRAGIYSRLIALRGARRCGQASPRPSSARLRLLRRPSASRALNPCGAAPRPRWLALALRCASWLESGFGPGLIARARVCLLGSSQTATDTYGSLMPNACTRPSLYVWVRVCGGPPCLCLDSVR